MKKCIIILTIVLIICVSLFIFKEYNFTSNPIDNEKDNLTEEHPPEKSIDNKVEEILSKMSLEQKIAQMLVLYYTSDVVDDSFKKTLNELNPGGFILMADNITSYAKTKKFVEDLQANSNIPMIISIDQEGGSVQRLQNLKDIKPIYIPYMYDLGKKNDVKLAYNTGKVMAQQLRTIGVNVVFAPVMDIYSNPNNKVIGKRSFGSTAQIVSDLAISLANGLEDNGVIATYKHFPGHGDTATDSHFNLPMINKDYATLKQNDLIPFIKAIENKAKIIMVGHLSLPNITNDKLPASLSKKLITDILINDLNYDGLVITDALNMGALTKNYSYEEIYTMAINAGVDLLLMPNGSKKAIEYIKKNVSEEEIDKHCRKILKFKYTYLVDYDWLDKSYLNNNEQQQIIDKINK